jgi:hypothetical protein
MSLHKNAASALSRVLTACAALIALTVSNDTLSAQFHQEACLPEPCPCLLADMVIYGDFLYWQVNPDGLEFARKFGISGGPASAAQKGKILSPKCELEPGFRAGLIVGLGCCEWDLFGQFTWLGQKFSSSATAPFTPVVPPPPNGNQADQSLHPLIYNQGIAGAYPLTSAEGEWDSKINVFDFGLGRTFEINACFDFRPHLGFKTTWQDLKYNVRYQTLVVTEEQQVTSSFVSIWHATDFSGIGLRGGFDASWNFTPGFRAVGGISQAAVWSSIEAHREDFYSLSGQEPVKNVDVFINECALIPVTELIAGLRYDGYWCDTDFFFFIGWEAQVWWNLNRFIFIENSSLEGNSGTNSAQFGPPGNIAYQGLTLRFGFGY